MKKRSLVKRSSVEWQPLTKFSPAIAVREDNVKEDASSYILQRRINEINSSENHLNIPAVLLSPCSRFTSKSEQTFCKVDTISSGFLVPPPRQLLRKRQSSSPEMTIKRGEITSYNGCRKFSIPAKDCLLSNDYAEHKIFWADGVSRSTPEDDANTKHAEIASIIGILKENNAFDISDNGNYIQAASKRDLPPLSGLRNAQLETGVLTRGATSADSTLSPNCSRSPSLLELGRDLFTCSESPQSRQLSCLLPQRDFAVLSSTSSLHSSDPVSVKILDDTIISSFPLNGDYSVYTRELCSSTKNEFRLPHSSDRDTKRYSAPSFLNSSSTYLFPHCDVNYKQHSTPDLPLSKTPILTSLPHTRPGQTAVAHDNTTRVKSSLEIKHLSSNFLHPDTAYSSNRSSVGSSSSLLKVHSLEPCIHGNSGRSLAHSKCNEKTKSTSPSSSVFLDSSAKSESSFIGSFLSLLSPSKLLSKLRSLSRISLPSTGSRSSRQRRRRNIDSPNDDKIVTLNVSGRRFKIRDYFLTIYPSTLLGGKARSLFYDESRNEFFFDRDPESFRYIWKFYYSGELHCPRDECVQSFLDEVNFFGLDTTMLCTCCWSDMYHPEMERLKRQREERELREKNEKSTSHSLEPNASLKENVWFAMKDPSFSLTAKLFYFLSVLMIAISVVANTTETIACKGWIRICKEENEKAYFYVDTVCVGFFTLEYIVRILSCPRRLKFVLSPMSIIDLLAILPYYIDLLLDRLAVDPLGIDALVVLRVLRILRICKLLRHSTRLRKLTQVMKDSAAELSLIAFLYLVMLILFSSVIYFAELREDSSFSSIPETMWYAVITSTTTGYGDIVPSTLAGRLVGSACCLFGILFIALPVPILQPK